ncbi:MAG TPA: sodium:solute symporter family protein [Thermoanaerobaculia bacterium]|jgi:Na+/proline symporter
MIDLAIVLAFVAYSVTVGFWSRKQASVDLTEYFLAGKTLGGWRAGLSMAATQFAADTPLLVMGLLAVGGIASLWRLWIYGLAFLMMGFVLGKAWRRAGVLTDAEVTEIRYSGRGVALLRGLKALYYGTVINCVVMAFVLVAAARIFEIFLPWHDWLPAGFYGGVRDALASTGLTIASGVTGLDAATATANNLLSIVLVLAFVALYSTTGGLRSVVATDVAQFFLMMTGTAIYAWIAVSKAGGPVVMLDRLAERYGADQADHFLRFAPEAGDALMPFLVILGLQWFFQMNSDGTGYLAQRTMACRDDRQARLAGVVFTFSQIVLRSLLWLPIGIALLLVYPFDPGAPMDEAFIAGRETLFARGIDELLPIGVRGIMLTGMLAALASTIDTHLNWGASYWANDLYRGLLVERWQRREATSRELVLVARLSNVLILAVALVIMVNLGSIRTAWQVSLLFGAGMGAVLVLRWLWERVNLWCEIVAIVTSLAVAPILLVTVEEEWLKLLLMSLASTTAVVVTAYAGPETDRARLLEFFRRVEPPGWWPETARAAGVDPARPRRDLARDFGWVAAAAASVYLWLVGLGRLMTQPHEPVLSVALVVLGCAAVPLWWRGLTRTGDEAR